MHWSKAFWLHPGGVSHAPTIRISILKLGGARTKPAALGKSQGAVAGLGPNLELSLLLGALQPRGKTNSSLIFPNTA